MSSSKAMEATYSSDGKELNIPIVVDKDWILLSNAAKNIPAPPP
jgi:hypothetical protein